MIDYQRLFHIGIRVPNLDEAMDELGVTLDLVWAEPRAVDAQQVWTPDEGLRRVGLRFVYSCVGPQHVELLEGEPGSPWHAAADASGVHHVGIWVDDLAAGITRCEREGWRVVAANAAPGDGYGLFAYLAPPSGAVVELVDSAIRPGFEAWWAAGLDAAAGGVLGRG